MKPSPHIEGLGSYAARLDDRMCFLAGQQTDVVFSEDVNKQYNFPYDTFIKMEQYRAYYNGHYPQMFVGFFLRNEGDAGDMTATFSLKFRGIDFGTNVYAVPEKVTVEWFVDIPDSFPAGEAAFQIYGASGHVQYYDLLMGGPHMTFLPTRF
jgi:hypothetical protein